VIVVANIHKALGGVERSASEGHVGREAESGGGGLVSSKGYGMEEWPWYPTNIGELKVFIGL